MWKSLRKCNYPVIPRGLAPICLYFVHLNCRLWKTQLFFLNLCCGSPPLRLKTTNYPNLQRTQKASEIKNPPRKFYPQDPNTFQRFRFLYITLYGSKGFPIKGLRPSKNFPRIFFYKNPELYITLIQIIIKKWNSPTISMRKIRS